MFNEFFSTLQSAGVATFTWLDNFGHDHWGFILALVFFLYVGDRLQFGFLRMNQRTQRRINDHLSSRMPRAMPQRMQHTSQTRRPLDPDLGFGQTEADDSVSTKTYSSQFGTCGHNRGGMTVL